MHAEEAGRGGGRGEPQKQTCGVEVHQKERGKGAPGGGTSLCKVRRPRPVKGPHHIVSGGWHSRSSCTFISGSPAPSSLWQVHGWLVSLSPVPGSLESLPGRQAQGSTQRRNINAPRKPAPLSGWGRRMASPRLTDQAGPSVLTRTHHGCWLPVLPAVCRGGGGRMATAELVSESMPHYIGGKGSAQPCTGSFYHMNPQAKSANLERRRENAK